MRYLLTLIFICMLINSAGAKNGEIYVIAGSTRMFYMGSSNMGGNLGVRTVRNYGYAYFNGGLDVYSYTGRMGSGLYYGAPQNDIMIGPSIGGGVKFGKKTTTFKIGTDVGFQFTLNGYSSFLAISPQASVTFGIKKGPKIGLIAKYNTPIYTPSNYSPHLIGGGILLRF